MSQTINITLKTYAIKIVRIKQYRRNKMYNENHNDIYDNNNISNKNQVLQLMITRLKIN